MKTQILVLGLTTAELMTWARTTTGVFKMAQHMRVEVGETTFFLHTRAEAADGRLAGMRFDAVVDAAWCGPVQHLVRRPKNDLLS